MKPDHSFALNPIPKTKLLCALLIISIPLTVSPRKPRWSGASPPEWAMSRSEQLDMRVQGRQQQGRGGGGGQTQQRGALSWVREVTVSNTPFVVSPDGRLGAIASGGNLTLIDLESGQVRRIISQPRVSALAFSRDGTELAVARNDHGSLSPIGRPRDFFVELAILDVNTGSVKRTWTESHVNEVKEIAYTSGGSLVAVGAHQVDPYIQENGMPRYDGLFLWNISEGRQTPIFPESKPNEVSSYTAAFPPIGHVVATSVRSAHSFGSDEELRLYDTDTGSLVHVIERSFLGIRAMAFSPDANILAISQGDNSIKLYDLNRLKGIRSTGMLPFAVGPLMLTADGKIVVMAGSRNNPMVEVPRLLDESKSGTGRMFILDLKKQTVEQRIDLTSPVATNRVVPGKNIIASVSGATLSLYDMQTGKLKSSWQIANRNQSTTSPAAPQLPRPLQSANALSAHRIVALSLFPDGKHIAAGSDDGALYMWDIVSGSEVSSKRISASLQPIALSADGQTVATDSGDDGSIVVSKTTSNDKVSRFTGMGEHTSAIALSARGDWLAAGSATGTIRIWHAGDLEPHMVLKGHKGSVKTIAFSHDATFLASGGEDLTVRVWDLESAKQIQVLTGHTKRINSVAFGADRNVLASCDNDATIILWDVRTGASRKLKGDIGVVRSICFSPDQSTLVSGGDNSLRLWDVRKGKLIRVLTEKLPAGSRSVTGRHYYNQSIMVVGFSPDGKLLACGSTNNSLLVLDASTWETRELRPMQSPEEK